MINQHLIVGNYSEILNHFTKKVRPLKNNTLELLEYVEIPTRPIKGQLDEIRRSREPQTGFLFYFIRNIINHEDKTFDVEINLGMEMVWIKETTQSAYPKSVFNEIIQHTENTDVIDTLKSLATRK